jgi:hypothetical protein
MYVAGTGASATFLNGSSYNTGTVARNWNGDVQKNTGVISGNIATDQINRLSLTGSHSNGLQENLGVIMKNIALKNQHNIMDIIGNTTPGKQTTTGIITDNIANSKK